MKRAFILILWMVIWVNHSFGQDPEGFTRFAFEAYSPLQKMKCGLWVNAVGDIAYKDIGCEVDEDGEVSMDSLVVMPDIKPIDYYITWAYDIRDSIPDDISEDDFTARFTSELKNVIDTASFKIISPSYFMDKNYVYIHQMMACGGSIFVAHNLDRKTFKVFESNPEFACDKHSCFALGRQIGGADPKTFRPIHKDYPLLSRDKNYIYYWDRRMTEKEIIEIETELGIRLQR